MVKGEDRDSLGEGEGGQRSDPEAVCRARKGEKTGQLPREVEGLDGRSQRRQVAAGPLVRQVSDWMKRPG